MGRRSPLYEEEGGTEKQSDQNNRASKGREIDSSEVDPDFRKTAWIANPPNTRAHD
jgi:hypothetical protein